MKRIIPTIAFLIIAAAANCQLCKAVPDGRKEGLYHLPYYGLETKKAVLSIVDSAGIERYSKMVKFLKGLNSKLISVEKLPAGSYMVKVDGVEQVTIARIY